ncbi:MAG: hypothetical protein ACHQNT_10790 [Bacteroidia bacterium]
MPKIYLISFLFFFSSGFANAQQTIQGIPWTGDYGITLTVDQIMAQAVEFPTKLKIPREHELRLRKKKNPDAPEISSFPPTGNINHRDGGGYSAAATQNLGSNFTGPTIAGWIPPDCNGAAGPTQVLVVANGTIRVYDKAGVLGLLNVTTDVFFNSVRNGSTTSDSHIRYDRLTQKWFVVAINTAGTNNRVMLAVSSGPLITGTASFTFFQFQHNLAPPAGDAGKFLDYPTLGIDANALYIGGVRFAATFDGCPVFVVRKSSVTGPGPVVVTAFRTAGGTASGICVPQGVDNDDPAATEGYFVGVDAGVYSQLDFVRINNPGGVPTLTTLPNLTVPANNNPLLQLHAGAAANRRLDGLDDRLFAAHVMKNKLTGVTTLWTSHSTRVNSSGVASGTMNRNASRWYQIGNMTGTPTLVQSGTLYDNAAANYRGFWISSIAMSGQGHAVLGCSSASVVNYADVAVAGRYSSDAAGSLQPFVLATASSTAYNVQATDGQRWGDYSQVVVDPNDNMTMWMFQEFCNATNSFGERVVQIIAPAPPPTASLNPLPPVGVGTPIIVNIIANSTPNNTGFFDPGSDAGGPGFANHITASVTGGITVNSITFIDATHVNISLNTSLAVSGTYVITITNPDGQSTTINITVNSALPVELISFTAESNNKNVLLNWTTASENNSDYFIIEKSKDTRSFIETGKVKAAGSSTSVMHYSFTDHQPYSGLSYYHLKQTDFNGEYMFSGLVPVRFGNDAFELLSVFSDFSDQSIEIYLNAESNEKIDYRLVDVFGKIVFDGSLMSKRGVNAIVFNGESLARGIYFLSISNGRNNLSKKLLY